MTAPASLVFIVLSTPRLRHRCVMTFSPELTDSPYGEVAPA